MRSPRRFPRPFVLLPAVMLAASLLAVQPASAAAPIVRDPADPAYVVHLSTGDTGRTWAGTERISFTNLRAADLDAVWLRLWSNGVLGCGGAGGRDSIEISQVQGGTADPLQVDCTAVRIQLDTPVPQGARGSISMNVRIQVPNRNDRFGYHHGLALLGTALPTLAVRDDAGWHHTEPFVDLGESFYSIVGSYRVALTVPQDLETPTTGLLIDAKGLAGGRERRTYAAKGVRDFAWAAGHLAHITRQVGSARVVVSYQRDGTTLRGAKKSLGRAVAAMKAYDAALGTFPYREMDVVVTAFTTFGGMEYPTIIFTNPNAISHEVAHQWWFGIVGDDEYHEPWLDEAFATWTSYVPGGGWHNCSRPVWPSASDRITNDMAYWAAHPGAYGTVVYGDGGCLLANLAHRFGYQRFLQVLHDYAQAHWLGVTRTSEFRQTITDAAAADGLTGIDAGYWAKWRVD